MHEIILHCFANIFERNDEPHYIRKTILSEGTKINFFFFHLPTKCYVKRKNTRFAVFRVLKNIDEKFQTRRCE